MRHHKWLAWLPILIVMVLILLIACQFVWPAGDRSGPSSGRPGPGSPVRQVADTLPGKEIEKALYITHPFANLLAAYDVETRALLGTLAVDGTPVGLAAAPDGRRLYLAMVFSREIVAIDLETHRVRRKVPLGHRPGTMALEPEGRYLYVTDPEGDRVSVVDLAAGSVTETIAVGKLPFGTVMDPEDGLLYVANFKSAEVSVIDPERRQVVRTLLAPPGVDGLARHAHRPILYAGGHGAGNDGRVVWAYDLAAGRVITEIPTSLMPTVLAVDPAGRYLFALCHGESRVDVIELTTHQVVASLAVGANPLGIAFAGELGRAYVINNVSDTVSVIDIATLELIDTFDVESGPVAAAYVRPGQGGD